MAIAFAILCIIVIVLVWRTELQKRRIEALEECITEMTKTMLSAIEKMENADD